MRQTVVLYYGVTGRQYSVDHNGSMSSHWCERALVLLGVYPLHDDRFKLTAIINNHHLLSGSDTAGKCGGHDVQIIRWVVENKKEVSSGEGDLFNGFFRFYRVKHASRRGVSVCEHDEVAVDELPIVVRRQHLVTRVQVLHGLLSPVFERDQSRAREAASRFRRNRVFCRDK